MRSLFFLLSFGVMSCMLIGCDKETACTPKTVASEVATMQNFATTNGLSVQTHSSGMLYQIVNPGSGLTPTPLRPIFPVAIAKLAIPITIVDPWLCSVTPKP